MGYCTNYKLHTIPALKGSDIKVLDVDEFDHVWEPDELLSTPHELFDGDECKWYDHDTDMLKVTKKHPGVVFILDGEGEESGDIWRNFYRDGKVLKWRPEINLPDFNEAEFVKKSKKINE